MFSHNKERSSSKGLFLAGISTAVLLVVFTILSLTSAANASPLMSSTAAAPPPPPTVPATLPAHSPTSVPVQTGTPAPHGSPTVPGPVPTAPGGPGNCSLSFTDVEPAAWFYPYVMWMACNGIANGYSDGTFRPGNLATRGQIVKIIVSAWGLPLVTAGGPHFADVAEGSTFYDWVETASAAGIVTGYPCGGPGEPCNPTNQPYYRPNANVTRAQLTKIIVLSAQQVNPLSWALVNPGSATFNDVPTGTTFFSYVETAVAHGVLEGYPCGGADEPCPGRYFRPNGNATRAQLSKMVYEAVVP